jgi:hypothetical protein
MVSEATAVNYWRSLANIWQIPNFPRAYSDSPSFFAAWLAAAVPRQGRPAEEEAALHSLKSRGSPAPNA